MDESYKKETAEACKCTGTNSQLKLSVSGCQLEFEDGSVFCKKSADSYCRDTVAKLAAEYRNAETGNNKYCSEKNPTYRGIQELAAYCEGR